MSNPRKISRRQFIREANCAAVGTASLFSSLFSLRLTAGVVSGSQLPGYKAMVCLFLSGGNDSFNMLVPRNPDAYSDYLGVRGFRDSSDNYVGLALQDTLLNPGVADADELLPISSEGQPFADFGIHHKLPILQQLYNQGNAAFVSNVGTLVEPTTLAQYKNESTQLPKGLFSHRDEQVHWQTLVPQVRGAGPKGWAGRIADCMAQVNQTGAISMNVSLSGTNVLQAGQSTVPYITAPNGAVQLKDYGTDPTTQFAADSFLGQHYRNLYERSLAQGNRKSIDTAIAFADATNTVTLNNSFPNTNSGKRLKAIAKIIAARGNLSMERQIFFLRRGGWDHHKEVITAQDALFTELNDSITAFWNEMVSRGMENDVVLFTASDFGRTLTTNGRGSDHAWGGNHFVIGGGINGGRIYGQYPLLAQGGPQDVGRGRLLPTTSVDAYGAELASWFGAPSEELTTIFPNAGNFFDPITTPFPLGMLG